MKDIESPVATSPEVDAPRIERVETLLLDLPTIRPHRLSVTTVRSQAIVIVRILCSDGVVGIGEATTIGGLAYGSESPEGMKLTIDQYISPLLTKSQFVSVGQLMLKLNRSIKGNHFVKCAVETALFDAFAKRLRVPLSDLFGGRLRNRLPVIWTLASGDTARDIAEAEEMLDLKRHNLFKLKIGFRSLAEDVKHVEQICKAFSGRAKIRVDVNMAWSESEASRGLPALADAGCELVEQPVSSSAALARLVRRYPVPLMADELLQGPESAFELATRAAADVFSVKIEQSGGLLSALKVAAIAEVAGIAIYGGTMLEGPVGTAAAAHLFSTLPTIQWGTEFFGPLLLQEEILVEPLSYSDFHLSLPHGTGLGVTLDEDKLRFFQRDSERGRFNLPPV
jgi:muconate cycloisomerase